MKLLCCYHIDDIKLSRNNTKNGYNIPTRVCSVTRSASARPLGGDRSILFLNSVKNKEYTMIVKNLS